MDFLILNFTGFFFYSIYNTIGYFDHSSSSGTGTVEVQDVVFAYHACALTIITLCQTFIYPVKTQFIKTCIKKNKKAGNNKVSRITIFSTAFMWVFALTYSSFNGVSK